MDPREPRGWLSEIGYDMHLPIVPGGFDPRSRDGGRGVFFVTTWLHHHGLPVVLCKVLELRVDLAIEFCRWLAGGGEVAGEERDEPGDVVLQNGNIENEFIRHGRPIEIPRRSTLTSSCTQCSCMNFLRASAIHGLSLDIGSASSSQRAICLGPRIPPPSGRRFG